jgi:hypothetical protein
VGKANTTSDPGAKQVVDAPSDENAGGDTGGTIAEPSGGANQDVPLSIKIVGDSCHAFSARDLEYAIVNATCHTVLLRNSSYVFEEEVVVARPVAIIGHPTRLPMIDGFDAERAFRVVEGGFLDVRFVTTQPGVGIKVNRTSGPRAERYPDSFVSMLRPVH